MTKRSDVRSSSNADFHTVSLSSAIDLFYSGVDPWRLASARDILIATQEV